MFGKLSEVKVMCRGKKRQMVNNNTVDVDYYGLGDYDKLKSIAIQWLQNKSVKQVKKPKQQLIFSENSSLITH